MDDVDTTTAEGYMLEDRRLSTKDRSRLAKADWHGEGFYYLPEHLQWVSEPDSQEPGVNEPTSSAIPFFKDGLPAIDPQDPRFKNVPKTT